MSYNPYMFAIGQKLRFQDCIVVFDGCGVGKDGKERIWITFADKVKTRFGIPYQDAPYFQMAESKRISSFNTFEKAYKAMKAQQEDELVKHHDNLVEVLSNYRTHLDGSIIYVSELKKTKEIFTELKIDQRKITDLLYIAQINGDGELSNLSAGQMSGNPAIIIASDLYSVVNAITKNLKIQSVIFNASQPNCVDSQLDAFDHVSQHNVTITCITDTANSFDNQSLVDRGFSEWRWDKGSITKNLYSVSGKSKTDRRVRNCALHQVEFLSVADQGISKVITLLYKYKPIIEQQSSQMISLYDKLFSLGFTALRSIVPTGVSDSIHYTQVLSECRRKLDKEKRFIPLDQYNDLNIALDHLVSELCNTEVNDKSKKLEDILNEGHSSVCIVLSDRQDKSKPKQYWLEWCEMNNCDTNITFVYPQEYHNITKKEFYITVVVGWLSNKIMRSILFHFDSHKYVVLTYSYEEKWKTSHMRDWQKKFKSSNNIKIVKNALDRKLVGIDTSLLISDNEPDLNTDVIVGDTFGDTDELTSIEQMLTKNRYRQFGSSASSQDRVDACPVSFVGGLLAFYRSGHEIVTVTEIIQQTGSKIKLKFPEEINIGEFVVIRESDRDIIRDIADSILAKEGKSSLRNLSQKWKESLAIESLFSSVDVIHRKLKDAGCKKGLLTVKNWVTNDSFIAPQDKDDLLYIAAATNDEVLLEKADIIYAAGKEVKSAHIRAGRVLSARLKQMIILALQEMGELDPFNVWDPISLKLEDIGNVKILKVIDIGEVVPIEVVNTNRLLSE